MPALVANSSLPAPVFQIARQSGKIRVGSPIWPVPVEPDRVPTKINLADSVRGTLILH